MRWVRANQPAGAIIRLQSIIGQSRRVIDNLIDCNLIMEKKHKINIFIANKNSIRKHGKKKYTNGKFIVQYEYLFLLYLIFWCSRSISKLNWPIVWKLFINICKTYKSNETRKKKLFADYTIRIVGVFSTYIREFLMKFRDKMTKNHRTRLGSFSFFSCLYRIEIFEFKRIFARGTTAIESLNKPSSKSNFVETLTWNINKHIHAAYMDPAKFFELIRMTFLKILLRYFSLSISLSYAFVSHFIWR